MQHTQIAGTPLESKTTTYHVWKHMVIPRVMTSGIVTSFWNWVIRSQAPKSNNSKDMEKVQRLDECGREKTDYLP